VPTESDSQDITKISCYAHWTKESVRYNDTDRQGRVNNAVFVTFLEAGRVSLLYNPKERALTPEGSSFVLANLVLNFRAEILWPSEVRIGTTVSRMGNSSVTFSQALFVGDNCVATAQTVLVLIGDATRKSRPLPDQTRQELKKWRHRNVDRENVETSDPLSKFCRQIPLF
jgi:acyl-CoA thioester hydrolase